MFKKWLSISLVALLLMGGLVACSEGEQPADTNTETEDINAPATDDSTGTSDQTDTDASETSGTDDTSTENSDSSESTDNSSTDSTN